LEWLGRDSFILMERIAIWIAFMMAAP
jgi:hypothetical protein